MWWVLFPGGSPGKVKAIPCWWPGPAISLGLFSFLRHTRGGQHTGAETGPAPLALDGPALPGAPEPQSLRGPAPLQPRGWNQRGPLPAQPEAQLPAEPPGVLPLSLFSFSHVLLHILRDRRPMFWFVPVIAWLGDFRKVSSPLGLSPSAEWSWSD